METCDRMRERRDELVDDASSGWRFARPCAARRQRASSCPRTDPRGCGTANMHEVNSQVHTRSPKYGGTRCTRVIPIESVTSCGAQELHRLRPTHLHSIIMLLCIVPMTTTETQARLDLLGPGKASEQYGK